MKYQKVARNLHFFVVLSFAAFPFHFLQQSHVMLALLLAAKDGSNFVSSVSQSVSSASGRFRSRPLPHNSELAKVAQKWDAFSVPSFSTISDIWQIDFETYFSPLIYTSSNLRPATNWFFHFCTAYEWAKQLGPSLYVTELVFRHPCVSP